MPRVTARTEVTTQDDPYVHGYAARESERLRDQARTLTDLLHAGTAFQAGNVVLEAGCAVGAQTIQLAAAEHDLRHVRFAPLTGLCDARPEGYVRRALAQAGLGSSSCTGS